MKKIIKSAVTVMLAAVIVFGGAPLNGFSGLTDWLKGLAVSASAAHTWQVGDIGTFGSYPQTRVTDSVLLTALNAQTLTWASYGYYSGTGSTGTMTQSDYMKYADVTYSGSKYRAVKFTSYRPNITCKTFPSCLDSYQYINGYLTNTTYWFRYEPLKWRVLNPSTGFVMCETLIDSQAYSNTVYWKDIDRDGSYDGNENFNNSAGTVYANDYATSSIRTWLNGLFLQTAFTSAEQSVITTTTLDNSAVQGYSQYNSATTNDKLYLLSHNDAINAQYGFSSNTLPYNISRMTKGSDYAKCQGIWVDGGVEECYNNSEWWLRTARTDSCRVDSVRSDGGYQSSTVGGYVDTTDIGVRPAFKISNLSYLTYTSPEAVPVTGVSLSVESFSLVAGESTSFTAMVEPADATNQAVTWSSSDETIATVSSSGVVTAKAAGTVTITVTANDTTNGVLSDTCLITVDKKGYYICAYSTSASLSTNVRESFKLSFLLFKDGSAVGKWKQMALVVGNSDVISVSDYNLIYDGYYVFVNGLSEGTSTLTVTDSDSKAYLTLTVTVGKDVLGENGCRLNKVPAFYPNSIGDKNVLTNFYNINGIYINNYSFSSNGDADFAVSFDAYNSMYTHGAVDIYDNYGKWIASKRIEKKSNISSLWDTGEALYYLINDTSNGELLSYKAASFSEHTAVTFQVPKDGYFTISNNPAQSPGTYLYNTIDLMMFGVEQLIGIAVGGDKLDLISDDIVEKTLKNIDYYEIIMNSFNGIALKASQTALEYGVGDAAKALTVDTEDMFNSIGLNWKSAAENAAGLVESIFENVAGYAGSALKGCFAFAEWTSWKMQSDQLFNSTDVRYVSVFSPTNEESVTVNGVSASTEDGVVDDEAVFQAFRIVPNDAITVSLNGVTSFDEYELYNICFVKNDTAVQPNGKVTVKIPIPEGLNKSSCQILRQENNGAWTILDAVVEGNYLVFETTHFSLYAIAGHEAESLTIKTYPQKLSYSKGEVLDAAGMTLSLKYDNSTTETISNGFVCSPTILEKNGAQTITVTYGVKSCTFEVAVTQTHNWQVGDIGTFGSYPQTRVTDSVLLSALNAQTLTWVSYGYYSGTDSEGTMARSDYMQYADVTYRGNKYRAVKFTSYRPYGTIYSSSASNSYQDDNGYLTGTTYWFKYEPLQWRVLDPSTGFVMSESIIDTQAYSNTIYYSSSDYECYNNPDCTIYVNDYATCSMRTWLNGPFLRTAFTDTEKSAITTTTLDNSAWMGCSQYNSVSTNDKLFLLSYNESNNTDYGFSSNNFSYDTARRAQGSDYAKCQGLYVYSTTGEYYGNSHWFLRSPGTGSGFVSFFSNFGNVYFRNDVYGTSIGVRPAIKMSNLSLLEFIPVTGVSLSDESLSLIAGGTAQLTASVEPVDATNKSVTWTSSNTNVALVDAKGLVTAKAAGTATITVTTNDGGCYDTCMVTVSKIDANGFVITGIPDKIYTGTAITPTVVVQYNGKPLVLNTDYTVSYLNNINLGMATVIITGKGNYTGTKTVTFRIVAVPVTGITLSSTALSLQYKGTVNLTVIFNPTIATNKSMTWSSSNEKVATVDANGNVTATGRGTASITATSEDGGKTATCTVTVKLAWWQWLIKILLFGWIWY